MKQELIQEEKNLLDKLDKICPIWSNYLRENPDFSPMGLDITSFEYGNRIIDITNGSSCMVGEAHGFPKYPSEGLSSVMFHNCEECYDFSTAILFQNKSSFKKFLGNFLDHWEKSHQ